MIRMYTKQMHYYLLLNFSYVSFQFLRSPVWYDQTHAMFIHYQVHLEKKINFEVYFILHRKCQETF